MGCSRLPPESGGGERLHYYDAASPIVAADSIDESEMYRKSRYDKWSLVLDARLTILGMTIDSLGHARGITSIFDRLRS